MLVNLLARQERIIERVVLDCPPWVPLAGRVVPLARRDTDLPTALLEGAAAIESVFVAAGPEPPAGAIRTLCGARVGRLGGSAGWHLKPPGSVLARPVSSAGSPVREAVPDPSRSGWRPSPEHVSPGHGPRREPPASVRIAPRRSRLGTSAQTIANAAASK